MTKIQLHIDKQPYSSKPSNYDIQKEIHFRITNEVSEVTAAELADYMGKGHTAVLATINGNRQSVNMIQQQVLMLDFDNEDPETKKKTSGLLYTSIDDILADPFIQANAAFLYTTFSHADDWHKFRVAFILKQPLTNPNQVQAAYMWLHEKFPTADKKCKDPARLFFGGKEVVGINLENTLSVPEEILQIKHTDNMKKGKKPAKKANHPKPEVNSGEMPTYKLIRHGHKEEVKKRLSVYGKGKILDFVQVNEFLRTLPMRDVLGIHRSPFHDIFVEDNNPSSDIFQVHNSNVWLYKHHSSDFKGDLIKVVARLLKTSQNKAVQYLIDVTGVQVRVTEKIEQLRINADMFKAKLLSGTLKEEESPLYPIFVRYKYHTLVASIIDILKMNVYEDTDGNLRCLTWISRANLAKRLNVSETRLQRVIDLMTLTRVIEKLHDSQIPEPLLKQLQLTQTHYRYKGKLHKRKTARERRSSVYELNDLDIDEIEERCGVLLSKHFTMKGLSREWVIRTFGMAEANRIYPQDTERTLSKVSCAITADIHLVAMQMIGEQGYVIEKDLMEEIRKKWKSKGFTEYKYKQAVAEMLDLYCLERKRLTKDLKAELGITHLPPKSMPTILKKAN